ncbi:MAG: PRC-barrel domain-containing protein [Chloroflexota bacterium]|nr:PRC-barrel domain-containing protein [Chloroflexota bacterium]
MNNKQIDGIAVISIADGRKLGTVDHIYFDPLDKRVVGFAVTSGGGLLSAESGSGGIIDAADVHSLGPDALTVNDASALRGDDVSDRYASLIDISNLIKEKVVSEGGILVGQVVSVEFDPTSYELQEVEVSPGYFKSNKHVSADQVTSIGQDVVVVSNAVCAEETTETDTATGSDDARWVVGDVKERPAVET